MQPGPRRDNYDEAVTRWIEETDIIGVDKHTGEELPKTCRLWCHESGNTQTWYQGKLHTVKRLIFNTERYPYELLPNNYLKQACQTWRCIEPYHHDVKLRGK